jgi:phosphate ABC transporter permease protein PstC
VSGLGPPLSLRDHVGWAICFTGVAAAVACLALTVAFVAREAAPAWRGPGALLGFLWSAPWSPVTDPPAFGVGHALRSTLLVASSALAVAVPLGVGIGVFAAEIAPPLLRAVCQPALELLAGIPAVVYGFFGYVTVARWLERGLGMTSGECLLAAAAILALMVVPFIASTSAEALRAVPAELRDGALALGVTRFHVIRRVVLGRALPGIFAAVALGLARALSETLAVLMLSGNSVAPPASLLDRGQPLTALLATELGESAVGSPKYAALYSAALVLLVVVLAINGAVWALRRRALSVAHG